MGCSKEDKKANENNTNIGDSQTIDNDDSDISTSLKNPKASDVDEIKMENIIISL